MCRVRAKSFLKKKKKTVVNIRSVSFNTKPHSRALILCIGFKFYIRGYERHNQNTYPETIFSNNYSNVIFPRT